MAGLTIRLRLTLVYTFLLVLALAISGAAVVTLLRHRLTARLDAALDHRLQGVENFLIRETTRSTAHMIPLELEEYASTQPEGHLIEVRDGQGRLLLKSDPVPSPARSRHKSFALYGQTYRTTAAASEQPIEESINEMGFLLLLSAPVLLSLIALTGYWISSRSLRPVDEMTRAARSISANNLNGRLPLPPARDEIHRLAEAWNEMLTRLEESFTRMQRFTADAAHELRTPLAALQTTVELSLRRERDSQEYREALHQIARISERMTQLAEGLLAVARGDHPPAPQNMLRVDVVSLVRGVAAEMQPLFVDKALNLQLSLPGRSTHFHADADGLRRLLSILLDNSLKYTPPGGTVVVSFEENSRALSLVVADTGCGIPSESLSRIFDRFYRVDSSRDRKTGGYGLGLAIAQQIARAHDGQIEATSVPGEGSTFRLRLPKKASSDANRPRVEPNSAEGVIDAGKFGR